MPIRLLDTTTLRMKVFMGEVIPDYAILSHTWVEDDEIDFQEMTAIGHNPQHPATLKAGYSKIHSICEKARRHKINYAWVDTCCIDKSSSAELSEAINSMFRWYRNAEVCYAFLADLEPGSDVGNAMKSCRWYTRGWTLQELIAPKQLRFYNRNWGYVGTKSQLKSSVCAITGIDQEVLKDSSVLPEIPIARRMFWASRRVTTRTEDLAYCLLGIFDVNMPLLYGEGEKAFIRLQEEIIKRSKDLSIFFNFTRTSTDITEDLSAGDLRGRGYHHDYPCRDLFATAPRDFSESDDVFLSQLTASSVRDFALTNNGAHFANARFVIAETLGEPQSRYYVMDLEHYQSSQPLICGMVLQKIGPGLFVRCSLRLAECVASGLLYIETLHGRRWRTEDAYIVSKISNSIGRQMRTCRNHAIRFESDGNIKAVEQNFDRILNAPSPPDNWDAAHNEFITMGEPFEGYVALRLFDPIWQWRPGQDLSYCYLVCSSIPAMRTAGLQLKLLEPHGFENRVSRLPGKLGTQRILPMPTQSASPNTQDQLILDDVTVEAKIGIAEDRDYPSYRITITLKFHDHPEGR
ncbi:HET-domain-containing protein [Cladophialophora carrionii]|uniref:HET-domain-containing protein n=1 Tax=Cladophialophora carrionii TaxID=86049 RepID=A0A1C1CNF6_9EURO|nr:HET-domain-containing protein [Cladophialophora carrionii]